MSAFRVVELFAGIGGVTGGLLDAGSYEPALLLDADPAAGSAFKTNFPIHAARYHVRSVSEKLTVERLADLAGGRIDGLLGCPPCQGLSQAGLRDPYDSRNRLLYDMRRLIRGVRPAFFIMENVPGLLRSDLYDDFVRLLAKEYALCGDSINAAEYGVPQLRRRAVVVGFRRDLEVRPSLPAPTHGGTGRVFDYQSGGYVSPAQQDGRNLLKLRPIKPKVGPRLVLPSLPLVTLGEALGDLPPEPPAAPRRRTPALAADDAVDYAAPPATPYQTRARGDCARALNHRAWRHDPDLVERLRATSPGDCPEAHGGRARNATYYSQAYARLHQDGLARTITTNFHNPGGGRFTHFDAPRSLTIREALRIQGFPDAFRFDALHASDAERLVGNAFPRLLAEVIGRYVARLLGPALGVEVAHATPTNSA